MRAVPVVLLLLVTVLAGCSGGTLDSTESVCDEFAGYVRDGGDRAAVVDSMGEVIGNADQGVRDAYDGLELDDPAADDTFARACFDAGWDG